MKMHECANRRPTMRLPLPRRMILWMVAACVMALSFSSFAGVFISVAIAPPPLPIYAQPIVPGPGYIWTPGYWSYADGGYFWVPGTWVLAPYAGALWTPGYWGWNNGFYVFNTGYWGPHVGFYGGINYGYGYGGRGYSGGYWNHGSFNYNRTVVNNTSINRVSFNGGRGGLNARPSPQEQMALHDRHMEPLAAQQQHVHMASQNSAMRASFNHGAPSIAATQRPGEFNGHGVVGARGAGTAMHADPARSTASGMHATHVNNAAMAHGNMAAERATHASNTRASGARPTSVRSSAVHTASAHPSSVHSSNHGPSNNAQHSSSSYRAAPAAHYSQQARPQAHQQAQPHQAAAHGGNQGEHHAH